MKVTQIRIAVGLAAVLGFGVLIVALEADDPVFADAVAPQGDYTAALCSGTRATFRIGTASVTCNVSSTSGTVMSSPSGQPICTNISAPTLAQCTINSAGVSFGASCTTSGPWSLCASCSGTSALTIPRGGVSCTASVAGQSCRAISTTAGPATIAGAWTNTGSKATFMNQSLPIVTSGGFPCPSSNTAVFSAQYCTNPAFVITPN